MESKAGGACKLGRKSDECPESERRVCLQEVNRHWYAKTRLCKITLNLIRLQKDGPIPRTGLPLAATSGYISSGTRSSAMAVVRCSTTNFFLSQSFLLEVLDLGYEINDLVSDAADGLNFTAKYCSTRGAVPDSMSSKCITSFLMCEIKLAFQKTP